MKNKKKTSASWMDCSFNELCRMRRDNLSTANNFCISTDASEVDLSEHVPGKEQKQGIIIPRSEFNKLVRAYIVNRKFVRQ